MQLHHTSLHHTRLDYTLLYTTTLTTTSFTTTLLYITLHYSTLHCNALRTLHHRKCKCNHTTRTTSNYTTPQLQLHYIHCNNTCGTPYITILHPAPVGTDQVTTPCKYQWIRSAICDSQQTGSPVGFIFWSFRHTLVRHYWYIVILITDSIGKRRINPCIWGT